MGAPQDDLNDDKLTKQSDGTPFIPYGNGRYTCRLTALFWYEGHHGDAWRVKFVVEESDRSDVRTGSEYMVAFKHETDKEKREYRNRERRALMAAIENRDVSDKSFDANKAWGTLAELHTAGVLAETESRFELRCVDALLWEDSKTKKIPKLDQKTGEQAKATNRYYNPVKAKKAA